MIPLLKLMPYGVVWLLFTFIYIFMPNTKVSFKSGLIGGVIAGTIYQIVQWGYITFQVGVSKYGAIYGSFAALPFFLVWLQLSWIIVLLGAEVSFAYQNVDTYEFEPDCKNISYSFKKLITVAIMHLIVKNFYKAQDALTAEDVSRVLEVPVRLVRQILFELGECYLIAEVKEDDKMVGYQPARDVSELTINDVINKLETHGSDNIPFVKSKDTIKLSKSLELLNKILQGSKENFVLKEI